MKNFTNFTFLWLFVSFICEINLESVPDTGTSWNIPHNSSYQLLPCVNHLHQFHQIRMVHYRGCICFDNQGCQQGGETGTRLSSMAERKNPMPAFRCHVNGCGELGYHKSAKVFSVKIIFKQFSKVFTHERNPVYVYYIHY